MVVDPARAMHTARGVPNLAQVHTTEGIPKLNTMEVISTLGTPRTSQGYRLICLQVHQGHCQGKH
jgi:hypothetical protein